MSTHLASLLVCLVLFAACGEPAPDTSGSALPEPGVLGKPVPDLGSVRCAIVERPAPDRAVIEAEWTIGPGATGCEVVLELPDGALLVEGERATAVDEAERSGRTRWTVEFPSGKPLDAVIRLCGTIDRGFRIAEAYARLTDGTGG